MVAAVIVIDAASCGVSAPDFSSSPSSIGFAAAHTAERRVDGDRVVAMALEETSDRGLAAAESGASPSDAASCRRTAQSGSLSSFSTAD